MGEIRGISEFEWQKQKLLSWWEESSRVDKFMMAASFAVPAAASWFARGMKAMVVYRGVAAGRHGAGARLMAQRGLVKAGAHVTTDASEAAIYAGPEGVVVRMTVQRSHLLPDATPGITAWMNRTIGLPGRRLVARVAEQTHGEVMTPQDAMRLGGEFAERLKAGGPIVLP